MRELPIPDSSDLGGSGFCLRMPPEIPSILAVKFSILSFLLLNIHNSLPQLSKVTNHRGHPPQLAINGGLSTLDNHLDLVLLRGPSLRLQELASPAIYILFEVFLRLLLSVF